MTNNKKVLWLALVACLVGASMVCGQSKTAATPHRVIAAADILKAGEDDLQKTLHYLMPDLFPKKEEAWHRMARWTTFYVNKVRFEIEELHSLDPRSVKRILIWERPWEQAPAELPSLQASRYVVSIETS